MNLFLEYQKKIFKCLKNLEKNKIIIIPKNLQNITVELPPKEQESEISCNAAMILAKINNTSPKEIAEVLKKFFLINFEEFKKIKIAGPGFININFKNSFWKKHLFEIIKKKSTYGSNKFKKKNIM